MSMGDEGEQSEDAASVESPKAGEKLEIGLDSYTQDALYSRSGPGGSAKSTPAELYRMEDTKSAWDASLDADIMASAAVLAEQMRRNPEDASQVAQQQHDDLTQFSDPLGLGVLNQSTLQLERADGTSSTTRRNLKKLARWQAEATMRLTCASTDGPAPASQQVSITSTHIPCCHV
jgi:hypothetical protein